jgi:para-nitrobenzyl esterase
MRHLQFAKPLVCVLCLAAFVGGSDRARAEERDVVRLDSGPISGTRDAHDGKVRIYKGIPFAAPPTGKLRWQAPAPPESWSATRACTEFSPMCPQQPYPAGSLYAQSPQPQSEDCLYLNVWSAA